jgi:ACS family allantoate permease-like MFS transporter
MTKPADELHRPADIEKDAIANSQPPHALKAEDDLDKKLTMESYDADAAMNAFARLDGQVLELTEEKNKELLRKIDWHLMPVSLYDNIERTERFL